MTPSAGRAWHPQEIGCTLVVDGNGKEDWVKMGAHLRAMALESSAVMPDVGDPITRGDDPPVLGRSRTNPRQSGRRLNDEKRVRGPSLTLQ